MAAMRETRLSPRGLAAWILLTASAAAAGACGGDDDDDDTGGEGEGEGEGEQDAAADDGGLVDGGRDAGGDGGPDVVPRGDRILGIQVNAADDDDYGVAFGLAQAVGMQATTLSQDWRDIESDPGVYANEFLAIANAYYPTEGTAIGLDIRPVTTTYSGVPADLQGVAWDDPEMTSRYASLLDWVFEQIPDLELAYFVIGSESDISFGTDPTTWTAYQTFYEAALAHVHALRPEVPVGTELTLRGLLGPAAPFAAALNEQSDVILVSHYPLVEGFGVEDMPTYRADIDALLDAHPGRPLAFHQLGFPTGPLLGSSEVQQAEFVLETFRAWDAHPDQIRLIQFTWMHDISEESLAYYEDLFGLSDPAFLEFLATLGLRTRAGADKLGWTALGEEAALRGWGG
jgi:hypothetical protein